jgi:uncharacterized membrane protein (DUF2068 family)
MQGSRSLRSSFFWATLFSIAMGFLEAAVVIYLRKLYYPEGFEFPMVPMGQDVMATELLREVSTIVMLLSAGGMLARSALERFAWFIFCFGVWDLIYYFGLWAVLGWPSSLATWDVLFLLPLPWFGPVYAPALVAVGLILLAVIIILGRRMDPGFRVSKKEWLLMIGGAFIIILSFVLDHAQYVLQDHSIGALFTFSQEKLMEVSGDYVPRDFDLKIYLGGLLITLLGMFSLLRRSGLLERNAS